MTFTAAHFHVTTAQFVINCTLKYALAAGVGTTEKLRMKITEILSVAGTEPDILLGVIYIPHLQHRPTSYEKYTCNRRVKGLNDL